MYTYSIIALSAFILYIVLIAIVLRFQLTAIRKAFVLYLVVASAWSLSTFLLSLDFLGTTYIWAVFNCLLGIGMIVVYFHFVITLSNRKESKFIKLVYISLLFIFIPLIILGYIPQRVEVDSGRIDVDYGPFLILIAAVSSLFFILSIINLIKILKSTRDSTVRNRIFYLLFGLLCLIALGARLTIPPTPIYPIEQVGHLCNSLVITYAIMRYQLFDIKLVIRKSLAYSIITIWITAMYLLFLYTLKTFFEQWEGYVSTAAIVAVAIIMAVMFNPMRVTVQKIVDHVFYGERYDYRQMVMNFARGMSKSLDLEELVNAMLEPIAKATNARQAVLLLPDGAGFISQYSRQLKQEEPIAQITISKDSPIITWLMREGRPLTREQMDIDPEFKSLGEIERKKIDDFKIEVFCSMISKSRLIGILALSRKAKGGYFTSDDLELVITLATEAAVAIENAQLYDKAKQRAHTDELTSLYNHRYFHERLDEEISRCSRFGEVFSLLFIDLDLFKAYNDIYGHLAGDEVLRDVGRYILQSIRGIDMAFRYGGDEFTVILPQATLEDAHKVGERIRRKMEVEMDSKGAPLTCSVGVASWPTDGVMRDEILRSADSALYQAKKIGRDRICVASDLGKPKSIEVGIKAEGEPGILSTIYALAATVDAKDAYTYGHSKKVAKYATDIATALGYTPNRIATLRAAALLHDIGKIGVSDQLLVKTGPLTQEDWEPIRSHPRLGVAIIKHVESLSGCLPAILYHHEHYDGTGYPSGLRGENIPLDARILAVADTYDAMTSLRPYRHERFTNEEAVAEIKRCAGTQFDPKIVDVFVNLNIKPDKETAKGAKNPAFLWNKVT